MKKILKKLFCLPQIPTLLITVPSYAFVIYVLVWKDADSVIAYVSYFLSAYALIITITGITGVLCVIRRGITKHPLVRKMLGIPLVERYMKEDTFRAETALYQGFAINFFYAGVKMFSGILYSSVWFVTLAVYYILFAVMRAPLLHYVRKSRKDKTCEWRRYRLCGIILLFMNVALAGIVILVMYQNSGYEYPGMLIYIMALYAFYAAITAVWNVIKFRKYGSPILSAAKVINLTAAPVSMLSLETAMLTQFGAADEPTFRQIMTASTGAGISVIVLGMAVIMIARSTKQLKILEVNMQYTKLGNSDLNVSRLCMGCMGFGDAANGQHSWTVDEGHSREIIKRGLELGVNFFDTAIAYQSGTSEQYVGRALRDFAKRDEVIVATKFLPRTQDDIAAGITGQQHIERMIDKSLANLGMDYVDLYIYHMWDYRTPLYDIMEGLNNIVKAGKARYIGISNCFAWQLAKANALAEREGFAKFVSIQGHYNLIFREEEREMAKLCAEDNIAMTPYSALAGGRLSKAPGETSKRLEEDSYAKFKYDATAKQDGVVIGRVAELTAKHGVSMTEISLAWLLEKVTAPVVGVTKLHHIEGAAKAVDLVLSEEENAYLEEPYVPHALVGVMAQNTAAAI